MKTATFIFKPENRNITIYGKVTEKNDKKISISLHNARGYSRELKFQAKIFATKLVTEYNFNHPSITHFEEVKHTSELAERLRKETVTVKEKYIERTKIRAEKTFNILTERTKWTNEDWLKAFKIEYKLVPQPNTTIYYPIKGYNSKEYIKMDRQKRYTFDIVKGGYEKFEVQEVLDAERHYENSILKLTRELNKKGITDKTEISIVSAWVGVNFEMEIKYKDLLIYARTIIAQGEIREAHYRYIITTKAI